MMRSKLLKTTAVALGAGTVALAAVGPAWAYAFESSAQYASYQTGGYWINNDEWGNGHGSETLWVNSASNWGVFSTQPNTSGVKSYPDESKTINRSINSLSHVTSSFSETIPGSGNFESAYDIWLNGHGVEVMIWTNTHNVGPLGGSVGNVTLDGNTWTLHAGSNGSNPTYSFVRSGNESSGTVNVLDLLKYLENNRHYYGNDTLSQVQYGFEISGTGNRSETFSINSYTVSAG